MSEHPTCGEYQVQDRWLAAALISLGLPLLRTEQRRRRPEERPGAPWTIFVVADHQDRPKWVHEYHAGTLALPVSSLRTAYNRLRNITLPAAPGAGREGA